MAEKLDSCVSCGAKVPEKQDYPYPGHKKDCELVNGWKKDREKNESADPLVAAAVRVLSEGSGPWVNAILEEARRRPFEDRVDLAAALLRNAAKGLPQGDSALANKLKSIAGQLEKAIDEY